MLKSRAFRNLAILGLLMGPLISNCLIIKAADVNESTIQSQFIKNYGSDAQKVANKYKLYSSVMMGQAALESYWGQSELTVKGNNFFGVKGAYKGATISMPTQEYDENGKLYTTNANFRKYPSDYESFVDNAELLRNGLTGNPNYYSGTWKENASTYDQAAEALTGTYATAPNYGDSLVALIKQYGLDKLDNAPTKTPEKNDFTPEKVKYYGGDSGEMVELSSKYSKYTLYDHIKGAYKNNKTTKFSNIKFNNNNVYVDMRGIKSSTKTTWYRIRFNQEPSSKKYWVYKDALNFVPVNYKKIDANVAFDNKQDYPIYNHVYNSDYLAKKIGNVNQFKVGTKYKIDCLGIQLDENQTPIVWCRVDDGKSKGWVSSNAIKQVMNNVLYLPTKLIKTINANSQYKLYSHVKGSFPNTKTYALSQLGVSQNIKVSINSIGYKQDTNTVWYRVSINNHNYWIYSKALD